VIRLKTLLIISFSIVVLASCSLENDSPIIILDLSVKDLKKLDYGSDIQRTVGKRTTFDSLDCNIVSLKGFNRKVYLVEFDEARWNNYSKIYLIECHEEIEGKRTVKFANAHVGSEFYVHGLPDKEYFELSKFRFGGIYSYDDVVKQGLSYNDTQMFKINRVKLLLGQDKIYEEQLQFALDPVEFEALPILRLEKGRKSKIIPLEAFNKYTYRVLDVPVEIKDSIIIDHLKVVGERYFKNTNIIFKSGALVEIADSSLLRFENCKVSFLGTVNDKVKVYGSNTTSAISFDSCPSVKIEYSIFDGLSNYSLRQNLSPASIEFNKSKVDIVGCTFSNNMTSDDMINFFNTTFRIAHSNFSRINSDAIDTDFSHGEISNCEFVDVGNDGIDLSGSNVQIENVKLSYCSDKAVSAGENSRVRIENVFFFENSLGLVVKDGSAVEVFGSFISEKSDVDIALFQKKEFYETSSISIYTDQFNSNFNLIELGSVVKNLPNITYAKEVESLMYGKVYGKSSK